MDGAAADPEEPAPEWLTTIQAAEILGVSPRRVRQLVQRGFLSAVRRGKRRATGSAVGQVEVITNARGGAKTALTNTVQGQAFQSSMI